MKRALGWLLTVAVLLTSLGMMSLTASAATVIPRSVQIQWTNEWKSVYFGGQNLYDTGCGIFATVNAVGYLTGNEMSVTEVAQWAYDIKALNYYAGGTDRTIIYPKLEAKYGADYGFKVVNTGTWDGAKNQTLINHLKNGGVAIGHVYGHFIAVVGYDASTKYYHVYDSAPSSSRGTGNGDAWVSESWFTTSTYFTLDWFCLLTKTGTVINRDYGQPAPDTTTTADKLGTYMVNTETLNVRAGADTTYDIVTTVKQGDVVKVTALASNGWGKFVAPDGKEGWANISYYGKYVGIDTLAYENGALWGDVVTSYDNKGSLTLVNRSAGMAGYDFHLPLEIGTATTPHLSLKVTPNSGGGFYFGLTDYGTSFYMMRDCTSDKQLVEALEAPYMTGTETLSIDLSEWWKPANGERLDAVRFYIAPNSSVTINYFYFAAEKGAVTDERYNLSKATLNENLMDPATLTVVDRQKSGGYTYQNGVLTVESKDENGYDVSFALNKSFTPAELKRWLFDVSASVRYDVSLVVSTADGDRRFSLASDFWPELCEARDGAFLPTSVKTGSLNLYSCFTYNNLVPANGISVIKSATVHVGGVGTVTLNALQLANSDAFKTYTDSITRSDATPDQTQGKLGDVNGDGELSTLDARGVLMFVIGTESFTEAQNKLADFNGDGDITTADSRAILMYLITQ